MYLLQPSFTANSWLKTNPEQPLSIVKILETLLKDPSKSKVKVFHKGFSGVGLLFRWWIWGFTVFGFWPDRWNKKVLAQVGFPTPKVNEGGQHQLWKLIR